MQTSLDWPDTEKYLRDLAKDIRCKTDIEKFIKNIYIEVIELSRAEVAARHGSKTSFNETLQKINSDIGMVEEFILISKLVG